MTNASLVMAWLQLLALLAAEVGLIVLGVALLQRWSPTAAWRRTLCQAGITAVLVVTVCELSGSARVLSGWAASALAWSKDDNRTTPEAHAEMEVNQGIDVSPLTPSPSAGERAPRHSDALSAPGAEGKGGPLTPALSPSEGERGNRRQLAGAASLGRTVSARPPPAMSRSTDSVSDSMGVLWLCLVWLVGAALAGARACLAHCLFIVFQLRRRPVAERALAERVQALARALGIRRRVRMIESGRLTSPIAFGLIRPTVGLPPGFAGQFEAARQDAMLAHELAHLAAHDPFWCLLADLATVVLWWHPGVWWLRRQLHLASEMAADEASLLVADGPRVLAECLVELGARLTGPVLLGPLRVSGFRSHLGRRVQRLVHLEGRAWSPPPRLGATVMRIFGPMVMTIIVVWCTAWAAPRALMKGDSMQTIQLNWRRSLATFALLAAFNGPEAPVAVAQSDPAAPPPASAPEVAPAAPAAPAASGASSEQVRDAFRKRYGLEAQPAPAAPVSPPGQAEKPARGSKVEAKLNQIVLPEVSFDGLPLSEVLRYLRDESVKRDPDKAGVNFLINPNFHPVAFTGAVDPATGLQVATPAEQFDLAGVIVKFNLPLRNVTMKDVLDAIVTVADHPIEYALENYAVVFSAKPETVAGLPVMLAHPGVAPEPAQGSNPKPGIQPMVEEPASSPGSKQKFTSRAHMTAVELSDVMPQPFNVDFGATDPSKQVGPAAVGRPGDYWNSVAVPFDNHHTECDLKFAGGDPSPIEVEMINLGGCWSKNGGLGLKSPMLDTYNYPTGNRGGNSTVILHQMPPGKYNVYIYGFGPNPDYYGDYTLTVGTRDYGRKLTQQKGGTIRSTKWVEGSQYVKFSNVKVGLGEDVEVLIQPGKQVTDPSGRSFADAMICGLQLMPVK